MTRFAILATIALLAAPASAQNDMNTDDTQQWGPTDGPTDTRDGSYLIDVVGVAVRNTDGDQIGEIAGVLIDEAGALAAFHIEMGGVLDIGDEDVAVPVEAFTYGDRGYVSKMTEQQLQNLPEWGG